MWETKVLPWLKPIVSLIKEEYAVGAVFILGTVFALVRAKKREWIFLSFILTVYISVSRCAVFRPHYHLAAMPIMAVLSARLLLDISSKISSGKKSTLISLIAALVIVIPSAFRIVAMDYKMTQPDSRIIAKEWIEANIPRNSKIALFTVRYRECPPIISYQGEFDSVDYGPRARKTYTDSALGDLLQGYFDNNKTYRIYRLEKELPEQEALAMLKSPYQDDPYLINVYKSSWHSISELKRKGIQYIILPSYLYQRYFLNQAPAQGHPLRQAFLRDKNYFQALLDSKEITLIKEIKPGPSNLGPTLKILKVNY
jgi:hypothetical protein